LGGTASTSGSGTTSTAPGTPTASQGTTLSGQSTTEGSEGTTLGSSASTSGSGTPGTSSNSQGTPSSSQSTKETSQGTTSNTPGKTTSEFCNEIEYINTLIATDSVKTQPDDINNIENLITNGVDFTSKKPSFIINVPNGEAIVRDIKLFSSNVAEIEVVFTTESGSQSSPIQGAPTSLPTTNFPTEKVTEIVINVKKTTDGNAPKDVTLSIIVCAEGTTITTGAGKRFKLTSSELNENLKTFDIVEITRIDMVEIA
jgi:hypothetical protein